MRKKFIIERTLVSSALAVVFLLTFSSKGFGKEIELRLTYFESQNQKTQIEIETSKPIHYHWFYTTTPPALVVDFFEDEIYSYFDKEIILEEGPIERIETSCFDGEGRVDFLLFKLRHAPKVVATPDARSLIVKINNVLLKGEDESLQRQTELESALNLARQKLRQAKSVKYPIMDSQKGIDVEGEALLTSEKETPSIMTASASSRAEGENSRLSKTPLGQGTSRPGEILAEEGRGKLGPYDEFEKVGFGLPFSDREILGSFISAAQVNPIRKSYILVANAFRSVLKNMASKNINDPQALSGFLPAAPPRPYGFLTVLTYLFGSLSIMCGIAFWYKVKDKQESGKLYVAGEEESPKQAVLEAAEPEGKTGSFAERRKFPRLEVDNLALRHRPRFRIETMDSARPSYDCRLRNLSLGGVRFELGPHMHVPLIAQMEITLPKRQSIEVCAKIVWYRSVRTKGKTYGACFLTIDEAGRQALDLYLTPHLHSKKRNTNFA